MGGTSPPRKFLDPPLLSLGNLAGQNLGITNTNTVYTIKQTLNVNITAAVCQW